MFPRYKRSARRYKIKTPKEKIPFEKRTLIQSAVSLILLIVFTAVSFVSPPAFVKRYLNTTYSWDMWHEVISDALRSIKSKSVKTVNMYIALIDSAEKRLGIQEPSAPKVKAEKTENAPKEKEEAKEPATPVRIWHVPAQGEITSYFGKRVHPVTGKDDFHKGIDIGAPCGRSVTSASDGTVIATGSDSYNGNFVVLDHGENITTIYAHLDTISVSEGDKANTETQIGTVGSTGISTGPHLHFEIKIGEESVNPLEFVSFEER